MAASAARRRTFALHDRYELYVDSGYGQGGDSAFLGNRDWRIDSYLYSRPLAEDWRIFAHNYTSRADFDGSTTDLEPHRHRRRMAPAATGA